VGSTKAPARSLPGPCFAGVGCFVGQGDGCTVIRTTAKLCSTPSRRKLNSDCATREVCEAANSSLDVILVRATVDDVLRAADDRRRQWLAVRPAVAITAELDRVAQSQLIIIIIIINNVVIIGCSCCLRRSLRAKMTSERVDVRESVATSCLCSLSLPVSLSLTLN